MPAAAERPLVIVDGGDESSRALLRVLGEPRLEPGSIRFAVDDQVIGVTGEAVDGALSPHRIGKGGEPFVRAPI